MRIPKYQAWHKTQKRMFDVVQIEWSAASANVLFRLILIMHETKAVRTVCGDNTIQNNYELREFTGLLDKNGKEIFEGDILNLIFGKHILEVRRGAFSFQFFDMATQKQKLVYQADLKRLEIIGNIYEPPVLEVAI